MTYNRDTCPPYVSLAEDSAKGRLVALAHGALMDAVRANSAEAPQLKAAFCALISTVMLRQMRPPGFEQKTAANETMVRHFFDSHLNDPDLSVEKTCLNMPISRSGLYRVFEDHGGVARDIAQRRLDRCLADLSARHHRRGQVRRVAEHWGFFDARNSSRRFYVRFGVRPSDCIGSGVTVSNDLPLERTALRQWMRRA